MTSTTAHVSWQDYLAIVIRRRWFFIVPAVAIPVGAFIVSLFLPKIYQAETTLLLHDPKIMNPLIQGMAVASPVEVRMRVVQEELLGWTSLSRLVHELGLDKDATTPAAFEGMVKSLRGAIQVAMKSGSLISLTYRHEEPEMAQKVLNTVSNIYIQRNVESQTAEAQAAIRFIESEMAVYKIKLEDSERALREFKELYTMEMPVATQLNSQVVQLEVLLAQLLVENTEQHPTVIQVRRQIQDLKQRRNEEIKKVIASAIGRSQSPEIYQDLATALEAPQPPAAADAQVQSAHEAYHAWVGAMDSHAKAEPAAAAETAAATAQDGQTAQPLDVVTDGGVLSINLAPRQEQELSRLRRDYEVHRKTYHEMQQRLERARITQRLGESEEGTKFKVIEPARLPLRPVSPNLWLIFCTALAIGAFVGVCAAFGAEYFDHSFQTAEDVQEALALPVLGSISTIVTEGDLTARRERMKSWVSLPSNLQWLQARIVRPVWSRVDRLLLRWGL